MAQRIDELPVTEAVDRRRFLNRTMLGALTIFGVAVGGASIGFLWTEPKEGRFGSRFNVGKLAEVKRQVKTRPLYHAVGKFYIVPYDTSDPTNRYVQAGVAKDGIMALYQKCAHLGCRTPYCPTSGYFECPCHGALFNLAGERRGGPAPAGMWRFPIEIDANDNVIVDTSKPSAQPPKGTDTTGQEPRTHCLGDVAVDDF
jgi:cytochrome b6-f complex iron-sulfur subunit